MRVASKNNMPINLESALLLEKEDMLAEAVRMYEELHRRSPADIGILTRLMIILRRLKKYRKEIQYIDKAIRIHEKKQNAVKSRNAKVVTLSKQLNVLLGHTDKKGNNLLLLPEVAKLKKRKEVAQKRMK